MIAIFDNVITKERCQNYCQFIQKTYDERIALGMNPMSFSTRLIDIDEPLIPEIQQFLESKLKINISHRWTQLQIWPVGSYTVRHIHDDPRAGDANFNSMLYLNDDFESGNFFTDDIIIKPKPGRLTLFNGREVYHGIDPVEKSNRYSIIFWWNIKE